MDSSLIVYDVDKYRLKLAIIIDKDTNGQLNCTLVMAGFRAMSQAEENNSEDLLVGDIVTSIGSINLLQPVPMLGIACLFFIFYFCNIVLV